MKSKRVLKEVLIWLPTALLAVMFLNAGLRKFLENGGWSGAFRVYGYSVWFRIVIGALETAGALLLLVPRTAAYGAATIVVVMIGAIATLAMTHMPSSSMTAPAVAIVVGSVVLAARWSRRWKPRSVGALAPETRQQQ